MSKKISLIILSVLFVALVCMLVYQFLTVEKISAETMTRPILTFIAVTVSIVAAAYKIISGSGSRMRRTKLYEERYRDELKYAFSSADQKKARGKLIDAIDYYNRDQFNDALTRLDAP